MPTIPNLSDTPLYDETRLDRGLDIDPDRYESGIHDDTCDCSTCDDRAHAREVARQAQPQHALGGPDWPEW